MLPDSRQTIHLGINFVLSPMPTISLQSNIGFQQSLVAHGIEFSRVEFKEREIGVIHEAPTRLEVKVAALGPPSVGQLLILAPGPGHDAELFAREAEAIIQAFDVTWPVKQRQLISCDATLRDLFEASAEHAFQELWEMRLHQLPDALTALGRPVLGGGVRFVMPPQMDDPEPYQIEVKIESFLRDTKKIFVETQFTWPQMPSGATFDPIGRLRQIDEYIEDKVIPFIAGG